MQKNELKENYYPTLQFQRAEKVLKTDCTQPSIQQQRDQCTNNGILGADADTSIREQENSVI